MDSCQGWIETRFLNGLKSFPASLHRAEITVPWSGDVLTIKQNPTTHSAQHLCLYLRKELSSKPVQTPARCAFETGATAPGGWSALRRTCYIYEDRQEGLCLQKLVLLCWIRWLNVILLCLIWFLESSNPGLQFLEERPQVLPTCIKWDHTELCDHENLQHKGVIPKGWRQGLTGRITLWVLCGAPQQGLLMYFELPTLPFLGDKHTWVHGNSHRNLWASQEFTNIQRRKLIVSA